MAPAQLSNCTKSITYLRAPSDSDSREAKLRAFVPRGSTFIIGASSLVKFKSISKTGILSAYYRQISSILKFTSILKFKGVAMSDSFDEFNSPDAVHSAAEKYGARPSSDIAMVKLAQEGVPASAFSELLEISELGKEKLASILGLSYKTVQRYEKDNRRFNALNSEQLLKIFALYKKATEIFTDVKSFNRWLSKPAYGLGDQVPLTLLNTTGGIDLIREELVRIEYGALA